MNIRLTVYFDDPFWVGVFERTAEGYLSVARIVFGAEPKDYEIYEFILQNYYFIKFSTAIDAQAQSERRINPKRLQRLAKKETQETGIGTKAQQAIKLEYEAKKVERKKISKEMKEKREDEKFLKHLEKKKEKKKGH